MAKERVSLYFNTDIPLERAMWEFISKDGRKSQKIKRAIEDAMNASKFVANDKPEEYIFSNSRNSKEEINEADVEDIDL